MTWDPGENFGLFSLWWCPKETASASLWWVSAHPTPSIFLLGFNEESALYHCKAASFLLFPISFSFQDVLQIFSCQEIWRKSFFFCYKVWIFTSFILLVVNIKVWDCVLEQRVKSFEIFSGSLAISSCKCHSTRNFPVSVIYLIFFFFCHQLTIISNGFVCFCSLLVSINQLVIEFTMIRRESYHPALLLLCIWITF